MVVGFQQEITEAFMFVRARILGEEDGERAVLSGEPIDYLLARLVPRVASQHG